MAGGEQQLKAAAEKTGDVAAKNLSKKIITAAIRKSGAALGPAGMLATEVASRILPKLIKGTTKAIGAVVIVAGAIPAAAGAVAVSVGVATLTTVVAIPLGLVLIIFIINAGAYVAPPSDVDIESTAGRKADCTLFKPETAKRGCFNLIGDWKKQTISSELAAIDIIMDADEYSAKLCAQGEITLRFNCEQRVSTNGKPLGGYALGVSEIEIYNAGVGSIGNTLYTLAHETGHIYDYRTSERRKYDDTASIPKKERNVCTYPFLNPTPSGEAFPEIIALYLLGPDPPPGSRDLSCLGGTFKNKLPSSWQFLRDNIFLDDLKWPVVNP